MRPSGLRAKPESLDYELRAFWDYRNVGKWFWNIMSTGYNSRSSVCPINCDYIVWKPVTERLSKDAHENILILLLKVNTWWEKHIEQPMLEYLLYYVFVVLVSIKYKYYCYY